MNTIKNNENSDYQVQNSKQNDSSFENSLCVKRQKKLKLKLRKERIYKQKKHGSWTNIEEAKFLIHVQNNLKIYQDKELRRKKKIFRQMSKFIKTRSSQQCRSHHQKYVIRFNSHDRIIAYLTRKLNNNPNVFQSKLKSEYLNSQEQIMNQQHFLNVNLQLGNETKKLSAKKSCMQNPSTNKQKILNKTRQPSTQNILQEGKGYKIVEKNVNKYQIQILLDFNSFF